jgi:hypothetical protein
MGFTEVGHTGDGGGVWDWKRGVIGNGRKRPYSGCIRGIPGVYPGPEGSQGEREGVECGTARELAPGGLSGEIRGIMMRYVVDLQILSSCQSHIDPYHSTYTYLVRPIPAQIDPPRSYLFVFVFVFFSLPPT